MSTMTVDREKILDKIKKLLALSSNNKDVNEAAAAAAKAQALIERYKIDMALDASDAEVEAGEDGSFVVEAPIFDEKIVNRVIYRFPGRVTTWKLLLAGHIGKVNGVKVWFTAGTGKDGKYKQGFLSGAGTEESIAVTTEMLNWLIGEVERLYEEDRPDGLARGEGKKWANGFKNGAVETIGKRLLQARREAREAARTSFSKVLTGPSPEDYKKALALGDTEALINLDRQAQASAASGPTSKYSLAKLDSALVRIDALYEKAEKWAKEEFGLRSHKRTLGGADGYEKGREAGRRAKLRGD
jgi:hypothetical protein